LAWTIHETLKSFTKPFSCSEFCEGACAARRNMGCIVDGDAQSEQDSLQEKGGAEDFSDFMNSPGQIYYKVNY
jgi:hypothetical protein